MNILEVKGLCKEYPKFRLKDVSFSVTSGSIMGLIGRNGAGKTTTLKSILNLIHTASGDIRYFGMTLSDNEAAVKQRIGFAGGAVDYYKRKKIRDIVAVTKRFYTDWSDDAWKKYTELFSLDEDKTPAQLSEGMRVKLSLAIAMSHGAELLILDEPTSGLDPVSREELLDVFRYLARSGAAILFSTHIISDLEKCADSITYIRGGEVRFTGTMEAFVEEGRRSGAGDDPETIMIHYEKEALHEKLAQ